MELALIYIGSGMLVGLIRGMLGSGGAFYIVPALIFAFPAYGVSTHDLMPLAFGTSAAAMTLVSLLGASAHRTWGAMDPSLVRRLLPGLVTGSISGPFLVPMLPTLVQTAFFGLLATYAATQMLLNVQTCPTRALPGEAGMFGAGSVIGASSSFTGGGGATLAIPFMLWCNVPMRTVIGTSSAIGVPLALVGAVGYVLTGLRAEGLPAWSIGFVYLPAVFGLVCGSAITVPLGAWLSRRLSVPFLKRLVAVMLYLVVARLLWKVL